MDLKEIDKEIEKLQALRIKAEAAQKAADAAKGFDEARQILGDLPGTLQRLFDLGYCPPRLKDALTDGNGKFNPGMYVKRPKASRENS